MMIDRNKIEKLIESNKIGLAGEEIKWYSLQSKAKLDFIAANEAHIELILIGLKDR